MHVWVHFSHCSYFLVRSTGVMLPHLVILQITVLIKWYWSSHVQGWWNYRGAQIIWLIWKEKILLFKSGAVTLLMTLKPKNLQSSKTALLVDHWKSFLTAFIQSDMMCFKAGLPQHDCPGNYLTSKIWRQDCTNVA